MQHGVIRCVDNGLGSVHQDDRMNIFNTRCLDSSRGISDQTNMFSSRKVDCPAIDINTLSFNVVFNLPEYLKGWEVVFFTELLSLRGEKQRG